MNKRSFYYLAGLYILSLICGIVLLVRQSPASAAGRSKGLFSRGSVAIVHIYGPIYFSQRIPAFGFSRDAEWIIRKLRKINEDRDIKAVVLKINSPGGSVAASQEIAQAVQALRKNKKIVVASMGDVAASGGYYIASQADKIVANPGTVTGSIGVIFEAANVQELLKKVGVRMEVIKSGAHKDIASPFRELSAEERAILQNIIDDSYAQFVDIVARGRQLPREKVIKLADGRVYTGARAKELGLVDVLGSGEDAVALATSMAGLVSPRIISDYEPDSWGQIFHLFSGPSELKLFPQIFNDRKIRLDYMLE